MKIDKKRILPHVLFWVVITLLYDSFSVFAYEGNFADFYKTLVLDLLFVTPTDMLGVYVVLYFLIPRFLHRKKYVLFGTFSLIFIFVLVFVIALPIEYYGRLNMFGGFRKEIGIFEFIQRKAVLAVTIKLMIIGIASTIKISKHWIKAQQRQQSLQKEKYETELKLKEAELKFLKSQINPHFLFNALNNLYSLTLIKSDKAPEVVLKISALLDYMLYECNDKYILLSKEIESLHNYIELQQIRFGEKAKLNIDIQDDTGTHKIAPLLILPFIENAVKHGLSRNIEDGELTIRLRIADEKLFLLVKNPMAESPETDEEDSVHQGIGLRNVKKRLELQYPNRYELKITNENNFYIVELWIKIENE